MPFYFLFVFELGGLPDFCLVSLLHKIFNLGSLKFRLSKASYHIALRTLRLMGSLIGRQHSTPGLLPLISHLSSATTVKISVAEPEPVEPKLFLDLEPEPKVSQ